jgi:hypothetical protein
MNELIILLDTVTGLTWIFGCAIVALAAGFLILDRPASHARDARPELRRAA